MKTYLLLPLLASCALSDPELDSAEPIDDETQEAPQVSTSALALGSDACRNTNITITNSFEYDGYNRAIRVQRVEFYSVEEGGWQTEDLNNASMEYGATLTWRDEDLAHAEGDQITQWRVYFNYVEILPQYDLLWWSGLYYQQIDTPNETCIANASFSMTVD